MKRFHRRCRRLCILAALLVLLVLFLRQNVLLDTASRHAILLDAQSGQVLAQKRADERTAPASLTSTLLGKLDGTELPEGAQIEGGKTGYTAAAGLCLASLATVNGKEYILVTLAAPGDHGTEQYNIRDAVQVYRKLVNKK